MNIFIAQKRYIYIVVVNLHVKDLPILLSFKDTLGVGTVSTKGKVTSYTVKTFKDLAATKYIYIFSSYYPLCNYFIIMK